MTVRKTNNKQVTESVPIVLTLTKSDTDDLNVFPTSFRVFNPNATVATLSFVTVRGESLVFSIPGNTTVVEELQIARVNQTGTTANLEIIGFFAAEFYDPTEEEVVTPVQALKLDYSKGKNSQYLPLLFF